MQKVSSLLDSQANIIPDSIFVSDFNNKYTYKEFNNIVNQCCNFFIDKNLKVNDVVSICLSNRVEFLILYFACLRVGCIVNLISTNDPEPQIINKINFIKSSILFFDDSLKFKNKPDNFFSSVDLNFIKNLNNYSNFYEIFNNKNLEDTVAYYYSSGTTNASKIICYSEKNIISGMLSSYNSGIYSSIKKHLCFLPLFHTAALRYSVKCALINGAEVMIVRNFWSIKDNIWEIVKKYNINFFQLVPSILNIILNNPRTNFKYNYSNFINFCGCGSSFLPPEQQIEFEELFNIKLLNLYGLSEIGTSHYEDPNNRKIGSIGKNFKEYEIKILDQNYLDCKINHPGQFAIKGDPVFHKYYSSEDYNKIFFNGFFLTGDYGFIDDDGFYFFVDRTKDLIIKGGINIAPNEIDNVMIQYKGVIESASIPIKDKFFGEIPMTFIVIDDNTFDDIPNLLLFCKKLIGDYNLPNKIKILKELPKGPSGKILKRELKKFE